MRDMTMLETKDGSPNGAIVKTYVKGETYSLPEDLADAFESEGWAEPAKPDAPNFARMTKTQLVDFAKAEFGAEPAPSLNKTQLIEEINRLTAEKAAAGEGDAAA